MDSLLLLLLHLFNGVFFQDNPGKPAPEKQNYYGKTNLDLLEEEIVSGSDISWAICKSAPRLRQIFMSAPHHSVFYRPDALPAAQPTVSKHWRKNGFLTFHKSKLHITYSNLLPNSVFKDPFHNCHSMCQKFNSCIRSTLHWVTFPFKWLY